MNKQNKHIKPDIRQSLQTIVLPALKEMFPYFNLQTICARLKEAEIEVSSVTLKTYLSQFMAEDLIFDAGRGWYSRIAVTVCSRYCSCKKAHHKNQEDLSSA